MGAEQDAAKQTLTREEANAIIADQVSRETAALTAKVTELETEKAGLESDLDVKVAEVATEKARADKAEADLEAYKTEREEADAAAEREEARVTEVKKHIKDPAYFTPERAQRWGKMTDEAFADFTAALPAPVEDEDPAGRETAMAGQSGATGRESATGTQSSGRALFAVGRN